MTKKILSLIATAMLSLSVTSCIEEYSPQSDTVTQEQVFNSPTAFQSAVDAITASLCGEFTYGGNSNTYAYDFGLPSFYLQRDVMGQDLCYPYQNWFEANYTGKGMGPSTARAQLHWTFYYKWIKNCNEVIMLGGDEPQADQYDGLGIAYCMRAYFYQDLARMYAAETYAKNKNAETVPIITEKTTKEDTYNNPRATNEAMWAFILEDLDKAEQYLEGYTRSDVYTPDKSVVYGLKARAYLTMEDWVNAEKYAKLAQAGYTIMDEDAYTNWETGFNTPNKSWMLGLTYHADDPNILLNDADSSWGSMMCMEIDPNESACGYAANYGQPFLIDRHLYETIPATDWRKKCYIDFAIDEMEPGSPERITALSAYSKHPDWLDALTINAYEKIGGVNLKFRTAGGEAGRKNQYIGFVVAVPMMRVEEMKLIEIEAAGMQNESRGIQLLTEFAKTRDASFTYNADDHNEAYGNLTTSAFRNAVWWQRRVEFWGEGLATFDIKRLNKGIIRSYAGTNHTEGYRWNLNTPPSWMNLCIVQTETNYNTACTNNTTPVPPTSDSPEHVW